MWLTQSPCGRAEIFWPSETASAALAGSRADLLFFASFCCLSPFLSSCVSVQCVLAVSHVYLPLADERELLLIVVANPFSWLTS